MSKVSAKIIKTPDKKIVEEYPTIWSGVRVYRTKYSPNWYFSAWISAEQKYYSKSLRTKDLHYALQLAEEEYLEIRVKQKTGEKLFSITIQELVDWYVDKRSQEVSNGRITKGRLVTIRSMCKVLVKFLGGPDVKVNSFTGDKFKEYTNFRLQTASLVTIKNERSTINNIFKEANEEGKVSHLQIPKWDKLGRIPVETRDAFTPEQYKKLYTGLRSWVKDCDGEEQPKREMIRDFILISANTGIRFGEMRRLKWRNVDKIDGELAEITLPWDITKNRKERVVVGKCGDYLKRLKKDSTHTHNNDFLFCDQNTGKQVQRNVYYKQWKSLMDHCGLNTNDEVRDLTYYSLRHTYATFRLLYGNVNPHILARNMGTSLHFLETHYSHIKTPEVKEELTRTIKPNKDAFRMVEDG